MPPRRLDDAAQRFPRGAVGGSGGSGGRAKKWRKWVFARGVGESKWDMHGVIARLGSPQGVANSPLFPLSVVEARAAGHCVADIMPDQIVQYRERVAVDSTFYRTSVTVDEAVMILMGWADGPIELSSTDGPLSPEEEDCFDSWRFSLRDRIEEDEATLENAWQDAREDKLPTEVIAEKREALRLFRLEVEQAKVCLCAVKDELNRKDASRLRPDTELSRPHLTYITCTSLDQWKNEEDVRAILALANVPKKARKAEKLHSTKDDPWWIPEPADPSIDADWYTPARHFARNLVKADSTLLTKRDLLASKVVQSLTNASIYKRGGKLPFKPGTVKRALCNVVLG